MRTGKKVIIGVVIILLLLVALALVVGYVPMPEEVKEQRKAWDLKKQRQKEDRKWELKQYIKKKKEKALRELEDDIYEGRPNAWERYEDKLYGK